jgi:hypothetical protein
MASRCESTSAVVTGVDPLDSTLERLRRVGGRDALTPLARLRIPDRDLIVCDGAGIVLYTLRLTATAARWEQRAIPYPPSEQLEELRERADWGRRARRLCLDSATVRSCRVPVGVVAAEARAAEEFGELFYGEEAVYRLSEAAAALLQISGKKAAKGGRLLLADVVRSRRPSHVPLWRLQWALAEEIALGHSFAAIGSRSPGFSESPEERSVTSLLCRRVGLQGTLDSRRDQLRRYARVAPADTAELLCETLGIAPGQVGL